MKLEELVETSRRISEASRRLEKIAHLAELLGRLAPEELPVAVPYLSGGLRQGRVGIGYAALSEAAGAPPAQAATLTLLDVDRVFDVIAGTTGSGSSAARSGLLRDLFARAVERERDFLFRLILGELRQGSLEGIMAEAVARAAGVPIGAVRRAVMMSGDLAEVARRAFAEGESGLGGFAPVLLRPLQPMLAQTADDVEDALATLGTAALEYKMDGARVQVHKAGDDVRVFSRKLNEVTEAVPELVAAIKNLPMNEAILDGEVIALREDGRPHAFQTTMRRFGRKLNVAGMRQEYPLSSFFFDCLYADGRLLLDHAEDERFRVLEEVMPCGMRMPRIVTANPEEAESFARNAFAAGHEGVLAKDPNAPYEAGRRGKTWLKVKRAHTLDLVVLAAEWGHGRRHGWLSNLHLGARNQDGGAPVMLGKTFKGLTDEMLAWQTRRLLELEISRDSWTVYVRPELVVEIAFNDLQASPRYPGGIALRFARVKRYRTDKPADEADTIETVRKIYAAQPGVVLGSGPRT